MRRFVFAPRWVVGHVLALVAIVSCLLLGDWQWARAEVTHSLQNMAYALQWPLFAVFFAVAWWRMLRLESRRLDEEAEEFEADADAGSDADEPESAAVPTPAPAQTGQSVSAPGSAAGDSGDNDDPELAAYNRMLAALAAHDQAAEAARRR